MEQSGNRSSMQMGAEGIMLCIHLGVLVSAKEEEGEELTSN